MECCQGQDILPGKSKFREKRNESDKIFRYVKIFKISKSMRWRDGCGARCKVMGSKRPCQK